MRTNNRKSVAKLTATLAAALLVAAPLALGADPTREEYATKVEPICKANTQANAKILKGARTNVKEGKFAVAAKQFARAATALEKTVKQLKATAQPPEDQATLGKWLGYVSSEATLLRKVSTALKDHNKFKAQTEVVRLTRNANLANSLVSGFGFNYCKFKPSRFT